MQYTDDSEAWWELDHAFAELMTARHRAVWGMDAEDDALEEYYMWVLEHGRGLEQEDYVKWVQCYAPELMHMVEV